MSFDAVWNCASVMPPASEVAMSASCYRTSGGWRHSWIGLDDQLELSAAQGARRKDHGPTAPDQFYASKCARAAATASSRKARSPLLAPFARSTSRGVIAQHCSRRTKSLRGTRTSSTLLGLFGS